MGWVKIEDRYSRNAKIMAAGEAGLALDVCGLCYCREHNTNGFVPDNVLTVLGPVKNPKKVVGVLVKVGRWVRDDELGGWWIHDYLECNPSDEVDRDAANARSDRARSAARARWDARSNVQAMPEQCGNDAPSNADPMREGDASPMPPSLSLPSLELQEHVALKRDGPVEQVFLVWQEATGHHQALLGDKRRRCIVKALKDYPLEDLKDACRGVLLVPHNRGDTNGTRYDALELVLRDSEHIERFRDQFRAGPAPPRGAGGLMRAIRNGAIDVEGSG